LWFEKGFRSQAIIEWYPWLRPNWINISEWYISVGRDGRETFPICNYPATGYAPLVPLLLPALDRYHFKTEINDRPLKRYPSCTCSRKWEHLLTLSDFQRSVMCRGEKKGRYSNIKLYSFFLIVLRLIKIGVFLIMTLLLISYLITK